MDAPEPICGLDAALAVMGGKWKPLILFHLQGGPRRFGELKRRVAGVSEKVLIQQLRELVAAGVLTRRDHQRVPPMVDYTMTPFGVTLATALMPLCEWGNRHRTEIERFLAPTAHGRDHAGTDERAGKFNDRSDRVAGTGGLGS